MTEETVEMAVESAFPLIRNRVYRLRKIAGQRDKEAAAQAVEQLRVLTEKCETLLENVELAYEDAQAWEEGQ